MMNEQMMAQWAKLPPEQQQVLLAQMGQQQPDPRMGMPGNNKQQIMAGNPAAFEDYEGQAGIIDDQQAKAEALRATATPQGRNLGEAGFQAANPLEHLSSAMNKGVGAYKAGQAMDAKEALSEKISKTQQDVAAAIRQQQIQKQQAEMLRRKEEASMGATPMETMATNQNQPGFA